MRKKYDRKCWRIALQKAMKWKLNPDRHFYLNTIRPAQCNAQCTMHNAQLKKLFVLCCLSTSADDLAELGYRGCTNIPLSDNLVDLVCKVQSEMDQDSGSMQCSECTSPTGTTSTSPRDTTSTSTRGTTSTSRSGTTSTSTHFCFKRLCTGSLYPRV